MAEFVRKTITVPVEIAVEMGKTAEVNWSQVASKAFELELKRKNYEQEQTKLVNVVNRLRESKNKSDDSPYAKGKVAGELWAREYAQYEELKRLATLDPMGSEPYLSERWGDKPRTVQLMIWMLGPNHPFNRVDIVKMSMAELKRLQKENPTSWDPVRKLMFAVENQHELFEDRAFVQGLIEGARSIWLQVKDEV
jgi:hypothetical protein